MIVLIWAALNSCIDYANDKLGKQGLAFIVGMLQNIIFHIKNFTNMVDVEALVNVAATSLVSGLIYAGISFGKDLANKYIFKLKNDDTKGAE